MKEASWTGPLRTHTAYDAVQILTDEAAFKSANVRKICRLEELD